MSDTTAPLTFLAAALDAAQRDAEAATQGPWAPEGDDPTDDEVYSVCETPDLVGHTVAYARGGDRQMANMVHIARHDPQATLRRIAADRKTLEAHRAIECKEFACDCDNCCAACRWTESQERGTEPAWGYPDPHAYPCPTVRNVAEGWGWTEETT